MKNTQFTLIMLMLVGVITLQVKTYKSAVDGRNTNVKKETSITDQLSYTPPERFDRRILISKVSKGDKDAAFLLATHYNRERLPEAAFYWFGIAIKLGHKSMSKESLEFYEHSIVGEFDSGSGPSE